MFRRVAVTALIAVLTFSQLLHPLPVSAQSNARTGCLNQWLFNGVWRAKVVKIQPIVDGATQSGWQVTEVWRNGTRRELSPADSSFKDQNLRLSKSSLEVEEHNSQALVFNTMAPSGQLTYTATFFGQGMRVDPNDKPKAVDVTFDNRVLSQSNKPHFSSSNYNFHYNLGCVASGARAQAEGGSTQLQAVNGCMNQWMSNGVWKMRVLAVVPNPHGTQAKDQNGWLVRQEWVNVSNVKVYPHDADPGNHVSPTNVSDEFLATKSGNNVSSANAVGGFALGSRNVPFPPGVPYTFEQLMAGGVLDPADEPTRLLVTFDTDAHKALKLSIPVPRYRMPANFRINLACGGNVTMAPGWESLHTPAPVVQQPAAQMPQTNGAASGVNVDPCSMLGAQDVASALRVGVSSIGPARRPAANECAWAVASHGGAPSRTVLLTMQAVQAPRACHGFTCLHIVQSVMNTAGVPANMPPVVSQAFTGAEMLQGLGDRAGWKDGTLTVVKAALAFQLTVQGSRSPTLATSEALARTVLDHLSP